MRGCTAMKSILRKIISTTLIPVITLAFVCGGVRIQGVMPEAKAAKAASDKGKYVKDIVISYASSKEKAEKELGQDYIVLNRNFNDGMSGDAWIGYSTTDNENEAIRDIKAMPMDGKYSTSDFEELLKNQKDVIEEDVKAVIPSIIEFTKNYDADVKTARAVYRLLNAYHEDDSNKNMGDYLLEKGHALAENAADEKAIRDLEKIYVEGNNYVVSSIESLLTKAQDTRLKQGSWITRMSMLGPDRLLNIYRQTYSGKSKVYVNKKMDEDFGVEAQDILEGLTAVREKLKEAENSAIAKADGDKSALDEIRSEVSGADIVEPAFDSDAETLIEAMYQEAENGLEVAEMTSDLAGYSLVKLLKDTSYGKGNNLYDFFMNENLNKKDLYTMVYSLSTGQKNIIENVGLYPLFESALAEYSEKPAESLDDIDLGENLFSVYEGVDRSVFDGDTAITDETLKNMETKQFSDPLTPFATDYTTLTVFGVLLAVPLTGLAIRSFAYETNIMFGEAAEIQREAIAIMENNLKMMETYDHAWKLQFLEEENAISRGSLRGLGTGKQAATAIEEMYADAKASLIEFGGKERQLAYRVDKYGKTMKAKFIASYKNKIDQVVAKAAEMEKPTKVRVPKAGWSTRIAYSLGAIAALAFTGYEIYCLVKHDDINFAHIPANMVSRTYEGDVEYLTYHVVTTKSGKKADIHDKKGLGWQVLYTTTDDRMGDPVLTSTLSVESWSSSSDSDMKPVTYFDYSYAADLADEDYTGKDTKPAYLFFRKGTEPVEVAEEEPEEEIEEEIEETAEETEEPEANPEAVSGDAADVEGSVFGGSSMIWIILLIVVVVGVGAGTGIYFRKKKKTE